MPGLAGLRRPDLINNGIKNTKGAITPMTDADRIKHARLYLDKLAHGISPLDDTPVPDGELLNNVHISRCLSYVTEVLDGLIENRPDYFFYPKKRPFEISDEQRADFEYSETPITVTEIARRLNIAADVMGGETQLRYSGIIFWLVECGLLAAGETGSDTKLPTELGREHGISTEERQGRDGSTYIVAMYNEAAQRHIVDNIDAIVEAESRRFQMQGQRWRAEDDALIRTQCAKEVPLYEIALELRRSVASVRSRCRTLGIYLPETNSKNVYYNNSRYYDKYNRYK